MAGDSGGGVWQLVRSLPGYRALRNAAFRIGAVRWYWRYRHWLVGRYREAEPPPLPVPPDPHRLQLLDIVASFEPDSLLEVGCGDGVNLALLAGRFPALRLSGTDVNPMALAMAERRVRDAGGHSGEFMACAAEALPFGTASADVVVSDAVFMYLPPRSARRALAEMLRVARRAAIVHLFADESLPRAEVVGGNWVHRFGAVLAGAAPGVTFRSERSRLPDEQWARYGAMCVVAK